MVDRKAIGRRLRRARLEIGYSQAEVEDKTEVAQGIISRYERGAPRLGLENMVKICKFYEVSLDEIVFGEEGEEDA